MKRVQLSNDKKVLEIPTIVDDTKLKILIVMDGLEKDTLRARDSSINGRVIFKDM